MDEPTNAPTTALSPAVGLLAGGRRRRGRGARHPLCGPSEPVGVSSSTMRRLSEPGVRLGTADSSASFGLVSLRP